MTMHGLTSVRPAFAAAIATFLVAIGTVALPAPSRAAELLMFEEQGCPWCARWNSEVGPGYPKSSEGQIAPLRRINIRDNAPGNAALSRPVGVTPTFVLVDGGKEIGRITGYPGPDFFWSMLGDLVKKMEQNGSAPDRGSAP